MKTLISGSSGLIGGAAATALKSDGHDVVHLVRPGKMPNPGDVQWDPMRATVDVAAIEGVEVVLHLSGAGIADGRWTEERKQLLRSSRIDTTRVLVDSLLRLKQKPRLLIVASAIGYYGNRGDEILTESSTTGTDFLALVCRDWEAEASRAAARGIRTVMLRTGVVLSGKGGALPKMLTPFKFGIGGRLGSGQQWMSWIAIEDVMGIIRNAIANEQVSGPVNVVAPNPVRNEEFTRLLAAMLHRPAIFPAPAFVLRLAMGEMADAVLLSSDRVKPERMLAAGYKFRFEILEPALRAAVLSRM
ncbi:MAG TPA: TIGR01777 family oxidoreductase [Candidatus Dormibacteraeota bacterium]|nr:TIGR01777 family oxidoreductase [Candidatus Dormibacteraeota bacterium]